MRELRKRDFEPGACWSVSAVALLGPGPVKIKRTGQISVDLLDTGSDMGSMRNTRTTSQRPGPLDACIGRIDPAMHAALWAVIETAWCKALMDRVRARPAAHHEKHQDPANASEGMSYRLAFAEMARADAGAAWAENPGRSAYVGRPYHERQQ